MSDSEIEAIEKKCDAAWNRYWGAAHEAARLRKDLIPVEEVMELSYEEAMAFETLLYELNGGEYHGQKILRATTASHTE